MPTSRVISGMEITLLARYVQAMGQPSFFTWRVWQLFDGAISSRRDVMSTSHDDGRGRGHGHGHPYGLMVIIILILTLILILIRSVFVLNSTLHSQRPKTPAARGCLTLGWHGFWSHPSPKRCPAAIDSMAMGEPSITKVYQGLFTGG